jgi:hypothetical protein
VQHALAEVCGHAVLAAEGVGGGVLGLADDGEGREVAARAADVVAVQTTRGRRAKRADEDCAVVGTVATSAIGAKNRAYFRYIIFISLERVRRPLSRLP